MSASGPVSDGPSEQEPLEELFGTVFDLADTIASRISPDEVEMRLRCTLSEATDHDPSVTAPVNRVNMKNQSAQIDPSLVALVARATDGDQGAWEELIERYGPLVYAVCTRYRLSNHDIEDVGQNVWLLLVEQIGKLREPAALAGWLATTTYRECLRVVTAARKTERLGTGLDDALQFVDNTMIDEEILMAERNTALRAAFAELPPRCQRLLAMLTSDPPCSYAEISATLQIPMGSIGPQRARCLERLRKSSALAGLADGDVHWAKGEHHA
jgi:RNA polymerase sigma factor (sigma-70 family)